MLTNEPLYRALKRSIRTVKGAYPSKIAAFALLPNHLHCLWTLPKNDADYALRWNLIKRLTSQQTRHLMTPDVSTSGRRRRELSLLQCRFWEHQIRGKAISRSTPTIFIGMRSNTAMSKQLPNDLVQVFLVSSSDASIRVCGRDKR